MRLKSSRVAASVSLVCMYLSSNILAFLEEEIRRGGGEKVVKK
jgi:hypothetical protein